VRSRHVAQLATFLWGVFPYVALAVMVVGTLYRYYSGQLTWTSKSGELFEKRLLIVGSLLSHHGIIGVFDGHVLGLLVPPE
jgi:nitrate reductase gamma subunit